jgi:hypothetical protein
MKVRKPTKNRAPPVLYCWAVNPRSALNCRLAKLRLDRSIWLNITMRQNRGIKRHWILLYKASTAGLSSGSLLLSVSGCIWILL